MNKKVLSPNTELEPKTKIIETISGDQLALMILNRFEGLTQEYDGLRAFLTKLLSQYKIKIIEETGTVFSTHQNIWIHENNPSSKVILYDRKGTVIGQDCCLLNIPRNEFNLVMLANFQGFDKLFDIFVDAESKKGCGGLLDTILSFIEYRNGESPIRRALSSKRNCLDLSLSFALIITVFNMWSERNSSNILNIQYEIYSYKDLAASFKPISDKVQILAGNLLRSDGMVNPVVFHDHYAIVVHLNEEVQFITFSLGFTLTEFEEYEAYEITKNTNRKIIYKKILDDINTEYLNLPIFMKKMIYFTARSLSQYDKNKIDDMNDDSYLNNLNNLIKEVGIDKFIEYMGTHYWSLAITLIRKYRNRQSNRAITN